MALDRSPRDAEPAPGTHSPTGRGHRRVRRFVASRTGRTALLIPAAVTSGAAVAAGLTLLNQAGPGDPTEVGRLANTALIQSTPTELGDRIRSVAAARAAAQAAQAVTPARRSGRTARQHLTPSAGSFAVVEPSDDETDLADAAGLTKAVAVGEALAGRSALLRSALADGAPQAAVYRGIGFVLPTRGVFTSGYAMRWGVMHWGIDLANKIGTPIYSVTDGTVISSGPASGFGMWVRVLHPGGWISVYGHINRSLVRIGEQVRAGQEIAEMGNRGQATGPHLHFEIWDPSGRKINPVPWLATRGIHLTGRPTGAGLD